MRLTFFTNFFNHHQESLSNEFYNELGDNYKVVVYKEIEHERIALGYADMNKKYDYIVRAYESDEQMTAAVELAKSSDVVMYGSAPDYIADTALKNGALVFKYSERIYKKAIRFWQLPKCIVSNYIHYARFIKRGQCMLCASAYLPADVNIFFKYNAMCFKWGYFPETKRYDDIGSLIMAKKRHSMLWAGRFLDWKHPDDAVRLCKKLKESGYDFELSIIGAGEMKNKLRKMIDEYKLTDCVHLLGSMPPCQVREYMERSQIYLFTSDRNEGWGAVLNEAMNSGCAVVASHAIGSVPFILENKKNGSVYNDGDIDDLYCKVKVLFDNSDLCRGYGEQAYKTITELWDAKNAAQRFLILANTIMKGDKGMGKFKNGPCSPAEVLDNNWYSGEKSL